MTPDGAPHRTMAEVLADILHDVQAILRAELRLAKAEIKQESRDAFRAGVLLLAGAIAALSAWTLALWTAVLGLATKMPYWAATAIVAAVLAVVGAALLATGRRRLRQVRATPERTAETLRDNLQWIRQSTR